MNKDSVVAYSLARAGQGPVTVGEILGQLRRVHRDPERMKEALRDDLGNAWLVMEVAGHISGFYRDESEPKRATVATGRYTLYLVRLFGEEPEPEPELDVPRSIMDGVQMWYDGCPDLEDREVDIGEVEVDPGIGWASMGVTVDGSTYQVRVTRVS